MDHPSVGMGDTSQTPQLIVDLGIDPPDITVWNPAGLDIYVDLGIPINGSGLVHSSPLNDGDVAHLNVDIRHGDGGVQEMWEAQSEPGTRSSEFSTLEHTPEVMVSDGNRSSAGAEGDGDDGQTSETQCEHYPKGSLENDGSSGSTHTEFEITANDISEVADADTRGNSPSSVSASQRITNRVVNREASPIPTSDSTEGLDEDDVLAACQLVRMSCEYLEDEANFECEEGFDETLATSRLVELSDCIKTDDVEESAKEFDENFRQI